MRYFEFGVGPWVENYKTKACDSKISKYRLWLAFWIQLLPGVKGLLAVIIDKFRNYECQDQRYRRFSINTLILQVTDLAKLIVLLYL